MEINHLENIEICTAYQGTQIFSIVENFLKILTLKYASLKSIDAIKQS